jgi:Fic family protein
VWNLDLSYRELLQPSFDRLYEKKALLHEARPLPQIALQKIQEALSVEWTYNSNSIEGNTLTLQETQLVLQEGITIKGKSLREHFEAKNHELALQHLYKLIKPNYKLNDSDILDLHRYVLRSIEEDYAGRLRSGGVRISGANFVPPNARKVPDLLEELIQFVLDNPMQLNDIELATVFHHKFVWIHPFFEGNGRTVRLAMNLLLLKVGFTPAIILSTDRKKYYTALNSANNGNYYKLSLLMVQALERTMNIYIGSLPDNDMGFMEISNLVREESLPYGQEYISLLARQGKIDAYKEGRNWLTTKDAVMEYISKRERKRVL